MKDLGEVEDEAAERAAQYLRMGRIPESAPLSGIAVELRKDAAVRLARAILSLEQFFRREECRSCREWEVTRRLGLMLIDEGRHLLRGALSESAPPPTEPTLRCAYRLIGSLAGLAAWSAPATQESHALASFPVAAARDAVAYSRFGSPDIADQESAYGSMLGFDPPHARLLLTSSGMTAYALIESFLLREVLKSGDCILLHPSVYFETCRQLMSLPQFSACTAAGGSRAGMLAAISQHQPRVVFADPLSNSADFRAIDMMRLLQQADQICRHETWFVVDSTLLSGGFDPFAARREHVRVLYYESGCKYLQFGMDLGPAGVVVVEAALAERFEQLRRGIGAIGSDSLVLPRASRATYLNYLRAQTACAEAVARAANDACSSSLCPVIEAVHPSQLTHPDHAESQQYQHLGGVLMFRFVNPQFNRRGPLEDFIDMLIVHARAANLALTAGVSFGFRIPRIGAAWSSYEADVAFLRLSAGVDLTLAAALGRLIVQCADRFVLAAVN